MSFCDLEVVAVFCAQKLLGDVQGLANLRQQLSPSLFMYGVDSSSEMSTHPSCKTPAGGVFSSVFFFTDSTANQLPFSCDFFVLFKTQSSALRAVLGGHVSTLGV